MQLNAKLQVRRQHALANQQARAMDVQRKPCRAPGCNRTFSNLSGRTQHENAVHPTFISQPLDDLIPPHSGFPVIFGDGNSGEYESGGLSSDNGNPREGSAETSLFTGLRATVEEVEDEEDAESTTNKGSQSQTKRHYHGKLNAAICDRQGNFLPTHALPSPRHDPGPNDWGSYRSRNRFELAEFLYKDNCMSAGNIDKLMKLWDEQAVSTGGEAPYANHKGLYETIDATSVGGVPWESFKLRYHGELPSEGDTPGWMEDEHEVWFRDLRQLLRNLLGNPDFDGEFDYMPFQEYDNKNQHRYEDFMSGNWAWRQADEIAHDNATHGSMFVPIILGSNKTTVSVATGQNEYWPIYMSIGNICNGVRQAHHDGVVLLGFLPIAKTDKRHSGCDKFCNFRRQLTHTSIAKMLLPLQESFTKPEVNHCPDGHFRRTIYGAGPYIADYPEQCLLTAIVQGWCPKCMAPNDNLEQEAISRTQKLTDELAKFHELGELWEKFGIVGDIVPFTADIPRADINELISPDILHQLIKGTFKDHLVTWVEQHIRAENTKKEAGRILDEVDYRISLAAPFTGVRRFPKGRGFKQWTGDDSKALMKVIGREKSTTYGIRANNTQVYLAAIEGFVPGKMVRAVRSFIEFCYLARRDVHDTQSLAAMDAALEEFHEPRKIFIQLGLCEDFDLPRQHSGRHWTKMIREFGAPNGLCSSITESKHIKAVKQPWRRSNRYKALQQMLYINQRLDKLSAVRVDFKAPTISICLPF